MENKKLYDIDFFNTRLDKINKTAEVIVPIVLDLLNPKSVIDIGCGSGEFLSVFKKKGINDIFGVDGNWVKKENLLIPKNLFLPHNLEKPLKVNRKFDFVICLETAEHIHEKYAKTLVKSLTECGPIILFSAGIPFQYGTGHINEKWLDYWVELFEKECYLPIDCIRKKIWKNKDVSVYYKQNMVLFVKKNYIGKNKKLKEMFKVSENSCLSKVHPDFYLIKAKNVDFIFKILPYPLLKLIKKPFELIIKLKNWQSNLK